MKRQQWTVTRCQVSHPAAERRWDQALQLLLATPAVAADMAVVVPLTGTAEENRDAHSRLCPGIDAAPGPGANH